MWECASTSTSTVSLSSSSGTEATNLFAVYFAAYDEADEAADTLERYMPADEAADTLERYMPAGEPATPEPRNSPGHCSPEPSRLARQYTDTGRSGCGARPRRPP